MSKTRSGMVVTDVSAFAKAIRKELLGRETGTDHTPVSHLELLNILARSAGFRNFQHLKASQAAETRLDTVVEFPPEPEPIDHRKIEQILRCFDEEGVLLRWPKKTSHQRLALWWCWAAMPARRDLTEPEVNAVLKRLNDFGDHVLMRREMIDWGMMTRSLDCKVYRRVETRPSAEAASLIARLQERKRAKIVPRPSGREQFRQARMPVPPAASPTSA